MYNLGLQLFSIVVAIASLFNEKIRKMWRGENETFRILKEKVDPKARYVWVHAASLGEFEQGRPIIEQIKMDHPQQKILLTFFSPSGYEVRKNYEGADIICYLPIDTWGNARKFMNLINIEVAFFIKYEFWYNYLHRLKKRNIPVFSVSSIFRENQIFFRWYGKPYSTVLKCFTHFYVQNEMSRQLLANVGLKNVTITGDTRFDRVLQIKEAAKELPVVEQFLQAEEEGKGRLPRPKVFVAGSSWPPDEEIFVHYFLDKLAHSDAPQRWKLIIAPHVIGEDHLKQIEKLLTGKKVVRYTDNHSAAELSAADVLIINCFGLLSSIYRYGDVSYVGGGFGVGIHNVLEAAVWNIPVIIGPNNQKFQEAQELKSVGGCMEIHNLADFQQVMDRFGSDSDYLKNAGLLAGNYVKSQAGATKLVLANLKL